MRSKLIILIFIAAIAVVGLTISFYTQGQAPTPAGSSASSRPGAKSLAAFRPNIPRAWDDKAVEGLEVPLAQRDRSPRYMSAEEYYKLKVQPIYRSYPVYAKGREPAGYREALKQKDPEIIFDPSKLRTKADWIAAGKLVFESDTQFFPARPEPPAEGDLPLPVMKDGTFLAARYYIRKTGVLEGGSNSCAGCHTRPMADGSLLEGAQADLGGGARHGRPRCSRRNRRVPTSSAAI